MNKAIGIEGNSAELIRYKAQAVADVMGDMSPVSRTMADERISQVNSDHELRIALIDITQFLKKRLNYIMKKRELDVMTAGQAQEGKKELMNDSNIINEVIKIYKLKEVPSSTKKRHSDDPVEQMFIDMFGPTDFDDPDQTGMSALLEDEDVLH